MQWHWGNIGSALAGLSTLVVAVAALIRGPAVVRAWTDRLHAQADTAHQEAETIRLERQRYLHGWSRHGVDTYEVALVSDADELTQAIQEIGSGNPTAYVVVRAGNANLGDR